MKHDPKSVIGRVSGGLNLEMDEMAAVVGSIMDGNWADDEIALLLNALRLKGETVAEVAGAARAMRQHMTPIRTERTEVIDTCGTGGDASGTFNISTAAALVTAASGVAVAKHGNRSISSKTGSADVLAELGVHIEAPVATVEKCLDQVGICFCFAPQLHKSMQYVAAARRKLGVPTIFNLLGPLCNPASAPYQLLGVGKPHLRELLAEALSMLGAQRAVVVSGADGLDEVTISDATHVSDVHQGLVETRVWHPGDFGMQVTGKETMVVDGPAASARVIRDILDGRAGPARDIVVINAAAALWVAGVAPDLTGCVARAIDAIDSGAAKELLARWVQAAAV